LADRRSLEQYLGMGAGYVLDLTDRTFGEFVLDATGLDIHAEKYSSDGTSKARKLRAFWKVETDHTVGKLLLALIEHGASLDAEPDAAALTIAEKCRVIARRLVPGGPGLEPLKEHAKVLNADYLTEQIRRMEESLKTDPNLAIGTAKELIETCCKTILTARGKLPGGTPDVATLTKATLKELKLVPEGVPDSARGADVIKRLLHNLGAIGNGLAELRGLYGTGHGSHGSTRGLGVRHARLAVGAAATLVAFLFETHKEMKP
jgi:hypothetical protein